MDIWTCKEKISTMDCIRVFTDQILAVGTERGNIYIRMNWDDMELAERFPRQHAPKGSQITNLKFSSDG